MDLKEAKSVKECNSEFMNAVKELSGRPEYHRSILNQAKFHNLEDNGKKTYFISDTRMIDKEDYIKNNKLELYNEMYDTRISMMEYMAMLTMAKSLNYCTAQGDSSSNELEFDGLVKNLNPNAVKDLDTLIENHLSKDRPMVTFVYGYDDIKVTGGVIVSEDDDFNGLDIYGTTHKYTLSDDLFSFVWQGYVEFSPELINKLTLYTYPIGEDGATI